MAARVTLKAVNAEVYWLAGSHFKVLKYGNTLATVLMLIYAYAAPVNLCGLREFAMCHCWRGGHRHI
jgi:hypothetical protein